MIVRRKEDILLQLYKVCFKRSAQMSRYLNSFMSKGFFKHRRYLTLALSRCRDLGDGMDNRALPVPLLARATHLTSLRASGQTLDAPSILFNACRGYSDRA